MSNFGSRNFENECRIGMKWRIKENDLKYAMDQKVPVRSENFYASKIPGVKYNLVVTSVEKYPNHIYFCFRLIFKLSNNINIDVTISVKSASYSIAEKFECDKTGGLVRALCTRAELCNPEKKFFVGGIMEIELEGTLKALGIKRKAPKSLSLCHILWANADEKDITIYVKDQEIKVHKWVLSSKSPVFKAALESGFMEAQEKKINITDFDFDIVELAIKHFYEFDIKCSLNRTNLIDLLRFADKYDIHSLHDSIQEFMIKELSEENVVEFSNASVTFNAAELKEFCICFLMTFVGNTTIIKNVNKLKPEIFAEIGRRSLFIVFS